jgi:2-phosphosulfolactate phosphatase
VADVLVSQDSDSGFLAQSSYQVAFEWGLQGLLHLSRSCDAVVVVDVLSFSTCIDIACSNGASVYPYQWKDDRAQAYADSLDAELARGRESGSRYSLSPASMLQAGNGSKIVLPSPNGAELSLAARTIPVYTASLRNARAVGEYLHATGKRIGVVAAGERWPDGSLRAAIEDVLGAGAVIHSLQRDRSPEADLAVSAFEASQARLEQVLFESISGRELAERGYPRDVELAASYDVSTTVVRLGSDLAYRSAD